jgi:drug/metabolite transporter (DMT)-like permease
MGGVFCVLLTLLAWASVPLFLRYFAAYIDGWTANGWRYGVAAVFWAPILLVGLGRRSLPAGLWKAAIVPSLFNCVGQSCFAWAPYYIEPGFLTFLLRFHIVFITVGAYLFFPAERALLRTASFWLGVLIVIGGAGGVMFLGHEPIRGPGVFGTLLGLGSGFLFAGYALSVRHFMAGVHPIPAFSAISAYTAAALIAAMVVFGEGRGAGVGLLTAGQFVVLILSAMIGITFAHALYYTGIARIGVSVSSGIILLQPIITSIASFLIFNEALTVGQWTAGVLALGGAALLVHAEQRARRVTELSVITSSAAAARTVAPPIPSRLATDG